MTAAKKVCLADWRTFEDIRYISPEALWENVKREMILDDNDFPKEIYNMAKEFILSEKYKSDGGSLCVEVEANYLGTRMLSYHGDWCLNNLGKTPPPERQGRWTFCEVSRDIKTIKPGDQFFAGGRTEHWYEVTEWGGLVQGK